MTAEVISLGCRLNIAESETIRALLMGTPVGDSAWWAVGWCLVILAIAATWGAWLFRRKAGRR